MRTRAEYSRGMESCRRTLRWMFGLLTMTGGGEGERGERRDSRHASALLQLAVAEFESPASMTTCMLVDKERSSLAMRSVADNRSETSPSVRILYLVKQWLIYH